MQLAAVADAQTRRHPFVVELVDERAAKPPGAPLDQPPGEPRWSPPP